MEITETLKGGRGTRPHRLFCGMYEECRNRRTGVEKSHKKQPETGGTLNDCRHFYGIYTPTGLST